MEIIKITKDIFYQYIERKNTSIKNNKGFYIQDRNLFIIAIDSKYYEVLKMKILNRKFTLIAEEIKTINKAQKRIRNYILIDTYNIYGQKSAKALFKRFNLVARKKRVLDNEYHEQIKKEYHELKSRNNEKISPKKSDN